jgi:phosphoribosylformylglycinamidine cyclo-ligase
VTTRFCIYLDKEHAQDIINISKEFGVDAKIIGSVEKYQGKKLTIKSQYGEFVY